MKNFSEIVGGAQINECDSYISWGCKISENSYGYIQADELKTHLTTFLNTPQLDIISLNNGTLEVKPKNVNKGAFLAKVLQEKFKNKNFDLIFAVGSDDSDEEMFKYIKSAEKYFHNFTRKIKLVTTTITKQTSSANFYFNEINDCIENLEALTHKERNDEKKYRNFSKNYYGEDIEDNIMERSKKNHKDKLEGFEIKKYDDGYRNDNSNENDNYNEDDYNDENYDENNDNDYIEDDKYDDENYDEENYDKNYNNNNFNDEDNQNNIEDDND